MFLERLNKRGVLRLSSTSFALVLSGFLVAFYNASFFKALKESLDYTGYDDYIFAANLSLLVFAVIFVFVSILTLPHIVKPFVSIVFITASCVAYFMDSYGVVMHRNMIQNIAESDFMEIKGLLSIGFIAYIFVLGVFPSIIIFFVAIEFDRLKHEIWLKIRIIFLAFVAFVLLIAAMPQHYASFFRNHKDVRQKINPINFGYAGISYLATRNRAIDVKPIENDARITAAAKTHLRPTLLILVVGETARADHFGINGYERDTTPLLARRDIISFSNVTSCGTETAVSIPCMFSSLGRKNFSNNKAKNQEGLLDVVSHAGFSVLWRDNNSGCKGTCDRVEFENLQNLDVPILCNNNECFDAILLYQLNEKAYPLKGGKLIVLHQKGSHGPDYTNRYPISSEYFSPVCKDNQLQNCSREELINSYDNTVRYTDYFLSRTIDWLSGQSHEYNTALLYLSDHGESLGENNLYLHGMPYSLAPREQTHIPFLLWMAPNFETENAIDGSCLRKLSNDAYSHDNLFHTVLGALNISTHVYKSNLDILNPCRKAI